MKSKVKEVKGFYYGDTYIPENSRLGETIIQSGGGTVYKIYEQDKEKNDTGYVYYGKPREGKGAGSLEIIAEWTETYGC